MKPSLLRRMILAQGMVIALIGIVTAVVGLWAAYLSKAGQFDDTLETVSSALVTALQDERDPVRAGELARRIQHLDESFTKEEYLKAGEYRPIYQVLDAQGGLVYRSGNAPDSPLTRQEPGLHTVEHGGEAYRVRVLEDPSHRIRALVAVPRSLMKRVAWRSIRNSPVELLILFAILSLFTWPVSRRALRPLRLLARSVEARSPRDLSPLDGQADLLETRPLIQALNRLFRRVEELLETQRRFIADAAEELQAPLAVIRGQVRTLGEAHGGPGRAEAGADLQLEVARAAQLVGQLLTIARLDAASPEMTKTPLDLAVLVQERLGAAVSGALGKGQDLGYEGPDTLPCQGSSTILLHAVDNLLANAIRFTPEGGRITLRLLRRNTEALLEVEDSGPGIPEAFREAVFGRFSRLPAHRSPGSGLGLAIVRKAVELHGGTVALADRREGPGLVATLRLPCGEGA